MENRAGGIDLHIHTTSSDGTRTVYETIQDAVAFGLSYIAITDHNQFAVLQPAIYQGLEIIPGAEFSTAYTTETGKLLEAHVVGLFFDGIPNQLGNIFHKIPLQHFNGQRFANRVPDTHKAPPFLRKTRWNSSDSRTSAGVPFLTMV